MNDQEPRLSRRGKPIVEVPALETRRCENCRYWDPSSQLTDAQPDTTGRCCYRPPYVDVARGLSLWPYTEDTDWCGSHKYEQAALKPTP